MLFGLSALLSFCVVAAQPARESGPLPARAEIQTALAKAVEFYSQQVASHGGYVWSYSGDLLLREGEAITGPDTVWVQPPGTPAVGMALLEAYEATKDPKALEGAVRAAKALVQGQLHSGGWGYSIEFDSSKRAGIAYRVPPTKGKPKSTSDPSSPGGWDLWRQRRHPEDRAMLDDDTTTSSLRFLMRIDQELKSQDASIHEAAQYGLQALMGVQYPIGAWSHNYDSFPVKPPDERHYPPLQASLPQNWSRTWTKDFTGCYAINDRITMNSVATLLDAHRIYGEEAYLKHALRGGQFLLNARLPEPQPAWAQQYDRKMQPVWDRKFEPPAITALESQDVLETLLLLYDRTGERSFLEAVPKSLNYLKTNLLADGKLARFYELKTNRPIFFTRDYAITYNRDEMPKHYSFVIDSRLENIETRYQMLKEKGPGAAVPQPSAEELAPAARDIVQAMDQRGAWIEQGVLDGHEIKPPSGIIHSATFIKHVEALAAYLKALR